MSWGVAATGKTEAVRKAILEQFAKFAKGGCICDDKKEEIVRQSAAVLIDNTLSFFNGPGAVEVSASGSQSKDFATKTEQHTLNITVKPLWSFVE